MTIITSKDPAEISSQILELADEKMSAANCPENFKISVQKLEKLIKLIAFLNQTNEVITAIDDFSTSDQTILVSAYGSFIGFGLNEPPQLADLISNAVGFSSSVDSFNLDGEEVPEVVITISMPNVIVWGDKDE